MKKVIFCIAGIICCIGISAQNNVKQWTLEECIQYAIEHNIVIKQRNLEQENAAIDLNTSKMSRLPNLNASMGQNWNFGRTQTKSGLYENQTQSNSSLSVNSSTPVFAGFSINNKIAQSKLQFEAATKNLETAKENLSVNVASLFLQVLLDKELLRVSEEQLSLSKSQVKRTEYLVEGGKVPVSQLYDIQAQVAKNEVTRVESENNLKLSLLDLAQILELEKAESFDIAIPETNNLVESNLHSLLPPEDVYNNAINIKPHVKQQELLLESSKKSLKIAEAGYMPSISLNMGYNTGYYYNYDYKQLNNSFSNQFINNGGEGIGLSMSIPIFNRFSVRNQVRSAKISILNQQFELENTKKTLYKDIQKAYLNATAAQEKHKASTQAVKASEESFKYARERYEAGKSTVFEFTEAQTKLIQSLSEQIQSKYDYIFKSKILDFYNGVAIVL